MFRRYAHRPSQAIIVHTVSGASFFGIIKARAADCLVLHSARSLPDRQKLMGDVDIPWSNIAWSQMNFPVTLVIPEEPGEEQPDVVIPLESVS